MIYKDYRIQPAPVYTRQKFQFVHINYDGEGDHRIGYGDSIEECKEFIDQYEENYREMLLYKAYQAAGYSWTNNSELSESRYQALEKFSNDKLIEIIQHGSSNNSNTKP